MEWQADASGRYQSICIHAWVIERQGARLSQSCFVDMRPGYQSYRWTQLSAFSPPAGGLGKRIPRSLSALREKFIETSARTASR